MWHVLKIYALIDKIIAWKNKNTYIKIKKEILN